MTKILAYDSLFIINPIRKIYVIFIRKILNEKNSSNNRLVLFRLDKENIFLRDKRNISGMSVGSHQNFVDAMSIKFYKHFENSQSCNHIEIKNIKLYKLYTRQVKLKLMGLLKGALRIKNLSTEIRENLEIITDRQTASIMKETLLFLNHKPENITWKVSGFLTACITVNSILMRFASLTKMTIWPSDMSKYYFHKHIDSNLPTVLINLPKRKPEDFFNTYLEEFNDKFNIILYGVGPISNDFEGYKRIKIIKSIAFLKGTMDYKNLWGNASSYISDILLIFNKHSNLSRSIDIVNSIFLNKIDAHISRLQTNVLDNYLAIKARKEGVFILGDVMEEIFYCDSAVCPSKSDNTESLKLALKRDEEITYRGSNSLIKYRLKSFNEKNVNYLQDVLKDNNKKRLIFYASDPSKDESQRYLTENFLINFFSNSEEYNFVIKTHPQDDGKITHYAYLNSPKSSNIFLIGDEAQKNKMISKKFTLINNFNFNSAISSSDGFLTFSSSSILQALKLDIKTGVVDMFDNGFYDYLINYKATFFIKDKGSLINFLKNKELNVSDEILNYCGLGSDNGNFKIESHLLKCLEKKDLYHN